MYYGKQKRTMAYDDMTYNVLAHKKCAVIQTMCYNTQIMCNGTLCAKSHK